MKVAREFDGIAGSFKGIVDAVSGIFDPAQREARKIVRDATREAAEKVAEAQAKVTAAQAEATAKALIAKAEATAEAIRNGTAQAAQTVTKTGFFSKIGNKIGEIGSAIATPFKATAKTSAKAGLWVVEQPVALAIKPFKWASQGLGTVFTRAPLLATGATAVAALVGIGSWWSRHKAANLQNEYMMQAMAAQQMQATQAPQQSWKNSASQADVDARIAADRAAQAAQMGQAPSHAAKVTAATAQPKTADVAAL